MHSRFTHKLLASIFLFTSSISAFCMLSPSAFQKLQSEAPEALEIEVLRVQETTLEGNMKEVRASVFVLSVERTATGLEKGDMIHIAYQTDQGTQRPGPGEVPVLEEQTQVPAFLQKEEKGHNYIPAAGAMSFTKFSTPSEK